MPLPARVSIVTLGAHDLSGLRAFYARLGWDEAPIGSPGWACFETGGALLALFPIQDLSHDCCRVLPPSARADAVDGAFKGFTLAVNVETDEDVDESLEVAREAGATVLREAEVAPWGVRSAYFADPEGNVWEIACLPGSSFDERDGLVLPEA
jgi:uncharacterized protein